MYLTFINPRYNPGSHILINPRYTPDHTHINPRYTPGSHILSINPRYTPGSHILTLGIPPDHTCINPRYTPGSHKLTPGIPPDHSSGLTQGAVICGPPSKLRTKLTKNVKEVGLLIFLIQFENLGHVNY